LIKQNKIQNLYKTSAEIAQKFNISLNESFTQPKEEKIKTPKQEKIKVLPKIDEEDYKSKIFFIKAQFEKLDDEIRKQKEKTKEILTETIKIDEKRFERQLNFFDKYAELQSKINTAISTANIKEISKAFASAFPNLFSAFQTNQRLFESLFQNYIALAEKFRQANVFIGNTVSELLTPAFQSFFNTIIKGGNAFQSFAQAAGQALQQLIVKLASTAAIAAILGPLLGVGASMGAVSNSFGNVFKFLIGFGGARAGGGNVSARRPYIVGENGMELFVPSTAGRIIPTNSISQFAGQAAQMINITVNGVISGNDLALVLARNQRYQYRNV